MIERVAISMSLLVTLTEVGMVEFRIRLLLQEQMLAGFSAREGCATESSPAAPQKPMSRPPSPMH